MSVLISCLHFLQYWPAYLIANYLISFSVCLNILSMLCVYWYTFSFKLWNLAEEINDCAGNNAYQSHSLFCQTKKRLAVSFSLYLVCHLSHCNPTCLLWSKMLMIHCLYNRCLLIRHNYWQCLCRFLEQNGVLKSAFILYVLYF